MATKRRRGSAKRTWAKQEAVRRRSAPGKRFIGETAGQVEKARRNERRKVARMARAAREARPAEAARTAGPGVPSWTTSDTEEEQGRREATAPAAHEESAPEAWAPSVDVSEERSTEAAAEAVPLGSALADLARSTFGLARAIVAAPLRLTLAIPRLAVRALRHA